MENRAMQYDHNFVPSAVVESIQEQRYVSFIHSEVKGRARFKVRGLYRSPELKDVLVFSLLTLPSVLRVKANTSTSTLLVIFDPETDVSGIAKAIDAVIKQAVYEKVTDQWNNHENGNEQGARAGISPVFKYLQPWHTMPKQDVVTFCKSNPDSGLSSQKARERLVKYGRNLISSSAETGKFSLFVNQFTSLPVGLLAGSAFISLLTGGLADAGLILSVVLINGCIGFVTENNAETTIRSLDSHEEGKVLVIRDGQKIELATDQLVVGDIILLAPGEVPADARLLAVDYLRVDESALTGESRPVKKNDTAIEQIHTSLNERLNMLYKGTVVTTGSAKAIVIGTGAMTELGKIKNLTQNAHTPETTLQKNLRQLGDQMVFLSVAICGGVFLTGLLRGLGLSSMLKSAVSLAIAAVPEGLPTVGTTTLAFGVQKLRKRNVLARTLHGVEALGSIQVFCFDKTGTLTLNEMSVDRVYLGKQEIKLRGGLTEHAAKQAVQTNPDFLKLLEVASLCNDTKIERRKRKYKLDGSPTEKALVQLALDAAIDPRKLREQHPRSKAFYRTETKQYMLTHHGIQGQQEWEAMKGNPSQVLDKCQYWLDKGKVVVLSKKDRDEITRQNNDLAGEALRVLGIAYKPDEQNAFVWLGMVGLKDPPRQGIKNLIADFHRAGIKTIMLTGDQVETARAIGEELGLSGKDKLVVAPSDWLAKFQDENEGVETLRRGIHIFPRVSPSSKLKIVKALQKESNFIVAMTGDGINDAPALRASNIGITLGKMGTSVAKDCADIVVADDELSTIYHAIMQGRTIRKNLRKSIHFLIATNLSEILLMFGGLSLGLGSPLNPMHLLWINLLTDIFPSLALSMEKEDPEIMLSQPENPAHPLFTSKDKMQMLKEAFIMTGGSLSVFAFMQNRSGHALQASTATFSTLTGSQLLHAISLRSHKHSIFQGPSGSSNPYLSATLILGLGLLLGGVYLPGLNKLLGNAPLQGKDSLISVVGAVLPFFVNEADKVLRAGQKRDKKIETI